jgi:3-hydroxyacyl-CoA dehydrogenase / 3-hydroxy-2-methylbutyryl-CoA dehydrogenase
MQADNAVGFITGGASGLGEATAAMLTQAGGRVMIFDRERSPGAEVARRLGAGAAFFAGDVTHPGEVEAAHDATLERFGRVDVTVNCAALAPVHPVLGPDGELHPLDLFRRTVDVNLVGLFDVVRHSALRMSHNEPSADGERGIIVNVASIAGLDGAVGQSAYVATKGAVAALTLELAREFAPHGIRVMTIAPGMMDTPMIAGADDALREQLIAQHVFPKRLGRPAEFAALVRTLMQTTMLNGEVVRLDAATRLGPH